MIDSKKRTTAKSVSWRIFAFIILASLTYAITKDLKAVTLVAVAYQCVQIVMFILHERLWNYIRWGKTKGVIIQMTGLPGAGKTTISRKVAHKLRAIGYSVELIDGEEYRKNISCDLGFSEHDRMLNLRRLGFVAKVLARNNVISIIAAVNPYNKIRDELSVDYSYLVYVKCSVKELSNRDKKQLYSRSDLPEKHPDKVFDLVDPFEEPTDPDLVLDTEQHSIDACSGELFKFIIKKVN